MRISPWLLGMLLASSALAQNAPPPPAEAEAEQTPRLQDLEATVDQLLREEQQAPPTPAAWRAEVPPPSPSPTSAAPAAAITPSPPAPPLTREQISAVERTAERGRLLIAIARAGLVATRDMLSRLSDPSGAGITGWIAEPAGNNVTVTFYGDFSDGPKAVYRASVSGGRVTERNIYLGADRPALNPMQARMASARAATDNLAHQACGSQPFNVLVVPPATIDAPVDVYQISAPALAGQFPIGGHFRSRIATDGSVAESRGFTHRCVDITIEAPDAGEQPRPISVTHLMDPMPVEVHLLMAQTIGRPLLVTTGEPFRLWLVTSDRIMEVRPDQG
ncbi:MAG: hypothetical protein ACT4OE_03300 [Sphingosinicella sp.]